ncbi:MAG: ABC transporter permease [Firmicutes bacterium]|nr:ABC transporter permease [Bacillota bacterium]
MKSVKAIFVKQARDAIKNATIFIQFILFPIMAYVMTTLISDPSIPHNMFIFMFAAMFVGMTPLLLISSAISEDKEHKSLRFLSMAGVKPYHYLLGIVGFILIACALVSVVFALLAQLSGMMMVRFIAILLLCSVASALLGAIIGVFSKNQQSATALATPIALIFALVPLLSQFNDSLKMVGNFFYTQQMNVIFGSDPSASIVKPLLIILANIAVFLVLFILAYKKKGLNS